MAQNHVFLDPLILQILHKYHHWLAWWEDFSHKYLRTKTGGLFLEEEERSIAGRWIFKKVTNCSNVCVKLRKV